MSEATDSIAYLNDTIPGLTTVYREAIALRNKGLSVHTFAIWPPPEEKIPQEARGLIEQTFYIFPMRWLAFLRTHLTYLLTRPRAYLGTLFFVLTRPAQSLAKRQRTLFHFAEAVYLAAAIEERRLRHVHAHFALAVATQALVVGRLTGIPFSFTAHAVDIFADQLILREKIEAARFIVAISEYNKRFLVEYVGDPQVAAKIHVVHSGIPIADFSPNAHSMRTSDALPLILSIGRLVEKKGFPFLIRACKHLRDQGYRVRCIIVGSGPQEKVLRCLIRDLGMGDWIELPGWLDQAEVKAYLEKATIFALPCVVAANGDRDGIPAALMEAMAMAKPCVSTAISGIPELIEDGHSRFASQCFVPLAWRPAIRRPPWPGRSGKSVLRIQPGPYRRPIVSPLYQ
jgi:glycosyltransferase involved in cell wall biosynthesis